MKIEIDREKDVACWNNAFEKVYVNVEQILFAYEYDKDLIMVKSKNDKYTFYLFDIDGNKVLSYRSGEKGILNIGQNFAIEINNLITVEYSQKYRIVVILYGNKVCDKKINLISSKGEVLATLNCPNHYCFSSLKRLKGEIIAVCIGDDTTKDKYNRNDWNFKVHLDNYYLEKLSVTQ